MFGAIAHIGIAVRNLGESRRLFERLLGTAPVHEESVSDQQVNTVLFRVGEGGVELLEASSNDSAIARFLEKRGEGIHHLSFMVDDIVAELARLKREGFRLIDETPRPGADNCLVAFVHPKSSNGVLIELSQKR